MAIHSTSGAAIRVAGVVKRFGDVVALDGIDLEVEPGTVFGLLGPNGAGKTTTVRILTTILKPDAGTADGARASTSSADPDEVRATHRPGRPVRRRRRAPDRPGEPAAGRTADPPAQAEIARRAPTSCSSASTWPTRPTARSRPTPAACAAGSTSPPPWCTGRRSCSSTSRPPGSIPRSRSDLWASIEELVADGTTRAAHHPVPRGGRPPGRPLAVVDHGRVIAEGTAGRAQGQLGATVLDVGLRRRGRRGSRAPASCRNVGGSRAGRRRPSWSRSRSTTAPGLLVEALRRLDAGGLVPVEHRPSASPASTTCSWRSPVTGPTVETTEDAGDEPEWHDRRRRAGPRPPRPRPADRSRSPA